MTESCGHVIWITGFCEICRVAHIAVGVRQLVVAIDMTRLTQSCDVCAGKSELRRAVIE